ncbi:MAG: lytic transglycosylase domain-containing protein [Planctomycetes bacterium]|nr:lytic transglycosylase domain-containing protein [Planctomycetota bacterium]
MSQTGRWVPCLLACSIVGVPVTIAARELDAVISAAYGYARLSQSLDRVSQARVAPIRKPPPGRFEPEIRRAALRNGVSPELLLAIVEVESNFNPGAVSRKGALGLGQVMPATAMDVGIRPEHLWHPETNAEAAARYLRWLGKRYQWRVDPMLIGYNAGPAAADGLQPVPAETRRYVANVRKAYLRRKTDTSHGIYGDPLKRTQWTSYQP